MPVDRLTRFHMNGILTRPKEFSKLELATLSVWFVAVGRWEYVNLTEAEAQHLVLHFLRCLTGKPEDGVRASYLSLQNKFMAMRRGTFESIQSEPPFSRFGRRNMKALVRAWIEGGDASFTRKWNELFCPDWRAKQSTELPLGIGDDSGEGQDTAIEVLTSDREDKVNGEYWYLHYHYGNGWRCEIQMSTVPDAHGRRYDILHIHFEDGRVKKFYFLL